MVAAPDADLHARLAHFHDAYQKAEVAGAARVALRKQLEALPFCPERVDPQSEPFERWKRYFDRWGRYMEQGGYDRLIEQSEALMDSVGEAANAVFDTPANTLPGAIEKLKISYMVNGDGNGAPNGAADHPQPPGLTPDAGRHRDRAIRPVPCLSAYLPSSAPD